MAGTLADRPLYPMDRGGCPFDPPAALQELRETEPISRVRIWDGSTPWLIARHADARAVLADARFSSDFRRDGYPPVSPGQKQRRRTVRSFISMDDPEHARYRKMLISEFTVKHTESLRPMITEVVGELLDALAAGPRPVDLVPAFTLPLPSMVICRMLGVPYSDPANQLALGTLTLLRHPDQAAALRDTDDPALVNGAVEELLRLLTIVHGGRRRAATEDVEVGGVRIRSGEGVIVAGEVANRDPAAFDDPDALDIHRAARHHVAFGFGIHQCLGQPLARLVLQVAYPALLRRFPTLAVAEDLADLPFRDEMLVYGPYALPVTW